MIDTFVLFILYVWRPEQRRDGRTRNNVINPRRACAARVTVVVLCVCVSTTILALQATRRLMSDTNSFIATRARKFMWRFC